MRLLADKNHIDSIERWFEFAPPKGKESQWKDGRSAKELARIWCGAAGPCVPAELTALFASSINLSGLVIEEGRPEYRVRFDDLPGEPRNTDLVAIGFSGATRVALSVEAKADEEFAELVADMLTESAAAIASERWTNVTQRIQQLGRALFPARPKEAGALPTLGEIRYQLLTAAAGALAFANEVNATVAVLVVHEFIGSATRNNRVAANSEDLDRFARRLSNGTVQTLANGHLVGPFAVPGNAHIPASIPLYVGKVQTRLEKE